MKIIECYKVQAGSNPHFRLTMEDGRNFGVSIGMVRNVLNKKGIECEMPTSADGQALVGMDIPVAAIKSHAAGEVVGEVTFTKEGYHIDLADFNPKGIADYATATLAREYEAARFKSARLQMVLETEPEP